MAAPAHRRKRTPEEIAKSMAIAKQVMENQKKKEGVGAVFAGRGYVFLAAFYFVLIGGIDYAYKFYYDAYFFFILAGIYVLMGVIYKMNPLVISIVSLTIFVLLIILFAWINLYTIYGGLIFFVLKVATLVGLISSIKSAVKYKHEIQKLNKDESSDLLDDHLI